MSDDIIKRLREAIAAGPTLDRHGWPQWKQLENLASAGNIHLLLDRLDKAEAENERLLNKLNALLMLVSKKYPGETRYETACRYIREAENYSVSGPKIDPARGVEKEPDRAGRTH